MNQRELVANFIDSRDLKFNPELFTRSDDEIIEELKNTILSCRRKNEYFEIDVLDFKVVDDYDEINRILFEYYDNGAHNKSKSKKKDNPYEYINLNDSEIRLLIVNYYIRAKDGEDTLQVIIAVPRIVDKYYFKINGIMRSTLYQIVDGSTYNNATSNAKNPSVTLKIIFMAVRVYRWYADLMCSNGVALKATYYNSRIFNKTVPAFKYFLAKYGYMGALEFLKLEGIYITREEPHDSDLYTVQCSDDIYVSVIKYLFDNDLVVQSFYATLCKAIVRGMDYETVFDPKFWVRSLGADFNSIDHDKLLSILNHTDNTITDTIDKGYSILDSFETIYDISTKNSLRLPEEDKADMYCVFRWMLREFNKLRLKDNLDISVKKIRFAEYVASLYAMKIARGIYRVADFNKRATLQTIRKAIRTNPNFLLTAITKCRMVSYRNMVSDMDAMMALKFTYKGVSGLGESSNQSIPEIYRSIHPSHVGHVDLDSSSDGNPGMTGTICPFVDLHDGFFTDYQEPNFWEQEFADTIDQYKQLSGMKEALIFEQKVLGKDVEKEVELINEVRANMQQLIKPIIYANEGEILVIGE